MQIFTADFLLKFTWRSKRAKGRVGALGLACLVLLASGLMTSPTQAQFSFSSKLSDSEREREFAALARDVTALEKQLGILKRVVKLVRPSVVHIEASRAERLTYGRRGQVEEAGSGVIVKMRAKHYVLTNRHVIRRSTNEQIRIKLADGRVLNPERVWSDRGTDIAVMEIDASDVTPARLGNSDKAQIGDFVIAFGSPFGLSQSVTYGILSAKGRRELELGDEGVRFQDFMQTDAAINPGNSGGPLVNLRGQLIGINTAIASNSGGNEGIGFTIPLNMVKGVARQLIQQGKVVRAFLGVNLDASFGPADAAKLGLPNPRGARISGVTAESPAAVADLRVNDVVLQFRGIRIDDDSHLVNLVGLTEVNKLVPIIIFRDGRTMQMNVKVGDRSAFLAE